MQFRTKVLFIQKLMERRMEKCDEHTDRQTDRQTYRRTLSLVKLLLAAKKSVRY